MFEEFNPEDPFNIFGGLQRRPSICEEVSPFELLEQEQKYNELPESTKMLMDLQRVSLPANVIEFMHKIVMWLYADYGQNFKSFMIDQSIKEISTINYYMKLENSYFIRLQNGPKIWKFEKIIKFIFDEELITKSSEAHDYIDGLCQLFDIDTKYIKLFKLVEITQPITCKPLRQSTTQSLQLMYRATSHHRRQSGTPIQLIFPDICIYGPLQNYTIKKHKRRQFMRKYYNYGDLVIMGFYQFNIPLFEIRHVKKDSNMVINRDKQIRSQMIQYARINTEFSKLVHTELYKRLRRSAVSLISEDCNSGSFILSDLRTILSTIQEIDCPKQILLWEKTAISSKQNRYPMIKCDNMVPQLWKVTK